MLLPFLVARLIAYLWFPWYSAVQQTSAWRTPPLAAYRDDTIRVCASRSHGIGIRSTVDTVGNAPGGCIREPLLRAGHRCDDASGWLHDFLRDNIDFATIAQKLTRQDIKSILDAAGSFIAGGYNIVLGIFNWFVVVLYVVFIMIDYERLLRASSGLCRPNTAQTPSVFSRM